MHESKKRRAIFTYLPIFGCISTGMIYAAIGVIAILSFLKLKKGGADEGSLIAFLHGSLIGNIFIWIILLGTICYIIWRIYESITDPYKYGNKTKGIALRAGIAFSTIGDALIAYSTISILMGSDKIKETGQPVSERETVNTVLQESWGDWMIVAIGAIVLISAIVQFIYGTTKGYKERLNFEHFNTMSKQVIHVLAWAGYVTRGIILGIISFFLIKAGITDNAGDVVNTDKAFDFIGDNVGHLYFILVALGTIAYGVFMFIMGIAYDTDKD